jgi:DNA-binding IclR family transcriptional regulator
LALFEVGALAVGEVVATGAAAEVATAVAAVVTEVAGLAVRANVQAVLAEHQSGDFR